VDHGGNALTFDGSSWSAPTKIDSNGQLTSVSCTSASFCAAVNENGDAVIYGVSSAQIMALARQLTPTGKAARIAALLKNGGFSFAFKAPAAGKAALDWYQLPAGAHLAKNAKPKPVLVATGHLSFRRAGTATMKIKLTAAGKRLLKHAQLTHAKRLKLTAEAIFTPTHKTPVVAVKTFTLKR